ncbi:MAG TPA: DUF6489 family protein [Geminicoccus sp.]|jgi:hypothetical protein|uniref:DUF6489 family protein n=1 Tax=Geminicoccus sp. TaxID=2024832 RepID=UPI002E332FEE|nr:DUF6489 family protein [Geminicoccus sp.]HEX2528318.1 DUF6489 family protein [Geminicoccus sp.]
MRRLIMDGEATMKVSIDIDCTPEEARQFLGLPDVAPMQKSLMDTLEKRLSDAINATDTKQLMETWLPLSKGLEQWQTIWTQMMATATGMRPPNPTKDEKS